MHNAHSDIDDPRDGWRRRLTALAAAADGAAVACTVEHACLAVEHAAAADDAGPVIGAAEFVELAASIGLFGEEPPVVERDAAGACVRGSYRLVDCGFRVRPARAGDVTALHRLERACWAFALRTAKARIAARIADYPQGQFVLEHAGEVRGVIYSQRIGSVAALAAHTMDDVHHLHDPHGPLVQLLAVNVDPEIQDLACGDQLLEFMLQRSSLLPGVEKIVAVTLCKGFRAGHGLTFAEYVEGPGRERDPVLQFHHLHGAEIAAVLPGYRPRDVANQGHGVLVEYDLEVRRLHRLSRRARGDAVVVDSARPPFADQAAGLRFLSDAIASLLGGAVDAIDPDQPLMEAGLDSAALLALKRRLEQRIGRALKPAFFFGCNTPRKAIAALFDAAVATPADQTATPVSEDRVTACDTDIAVIGIGCRLPGGIDCLAQLWDVLAAGGDQVSTYPAARGDWPQGAGIERGGFLTDGECFDPAFFRISPSEAAITDPQQRLLLEVSWACFEDACIVPVSLRGSDTGVFVGASNADHAHRLQEAGAEVEAHSAIGSSLAMTANRLSYFYDLHGPSQLVDTACSASLVALHGALQSLRAGECRHALVGGVNFICDPRLSLAYRKAGMLAADGRCKAFAAGADGYVRGEGAVVLLLRPLRDALADHNRIHAVIKGSAVNHGGQAAGLTVPNPQQQAALLEAAWRNAGIEPRRIGYLEAHGTGTALGDPIEIEGMQLAFARAASRPSQCGVGSVKSNLGHLESAAGLAGLLKVICALTQRQLPATLHVDTVSPKFSLQDSPLRIQTAAQAWDGPQPRTAGVSSFGSGGANAHVVVQECPATATASDDPAAFPDGNLFVASAIDRPALRRNLQAILAWLDSGRPLPSFTAALHGWQCGRRAFRQRLALHVRDFDDLRRQLSHWLQAGEGSDTAEAVDPARWADALARRDWSLLARCWMAGAEVDWAPLYAALPCRPPWVSLPGYAFNRERYWLPGEGRRAAPGAVEPRVDETRCLRPVWRAAALAGAAAADPLLDDADTQLLLWSARPLQAVLAGALPGCRIDLIASQGDDPAVRYRHVASALFAHVRALLRQPGARRFRLQVVADAPEPGDWVFGLRGLLKTASLEDPRLEWQIVALAADTPPSMIAAQLRDNLRAFESGASIRYRAGRRERRRFEPIAEPVGSRPTALRAGCYLITGGLGGLGRRFAAHILSAAGTRVMLTGRAAFDPAADAELRRWHATGRLEYRPLQLDSRAEVDALVAALGSELRGILHCAGEIADNYLVNKRPDEFARVLAPKLEGTQHLDLATRGLALDFFLLFSSVMAEAGNPGQADYACANGFLDQYAARRNALRASGERHGHCAAIGWPLWDEGGMRVDPSALALLQARGMRPMPAATGLALFDSPCWRDADQLLVLHGDPPLIEAGLDCSSARPSARIDIEDRPALLAATEHALMALVGAQLKIPPERRDVHAELADLGIDSIFINTINLALGRHFPALSKTLFFQYRSVAEVAAALVERHAAECLVWTADTRGPLPTPAGAAPAADPRPRPAHRGVESSGAIAVIGMSGVLPQARNLDEFWRNLAAGRDCVREVPAERWSLDAFHEPDPARALAQGRSYCRHGAFIDDVAQFDPLFFGIPPREAINIDPHERLFLQEAWRAMEDAGYSSQRLRDQHRRRVGVFAGVTKNEFALNGAHDPAAAGTWYPHASFGSIANRLSYFLDLAGPSMPIDTMCSASLTAIHEACEQIRRGACEVAFAGGVNLYLHPSAYYYLCSLRMLASDGRCRSFGAGGSGFVPGEGAAVVLLKSLDRALADGDSVHGVILASSVNHGGRTNGYTVPNPRAQAALIRETLDKAGIAAREVSCIEAHGTGTALGDPIELDGLQAAFAADTTERQFCALGSAKSAIGHLEAAAGIAGLLKVLLQMRHRQLAPTLHADPPNPNLDFAATAFALNRELRDWERPVIDGHARPRIAGVSSFGAGGVNAHVLVREPDADVDADGGDAAVLLPLSARRREDLVARAEQLLEFLRADAAPRDLARIACTLQLGRDPMAERVAFAVDTRAALLAALEGFVQGRIDPAACVVAEAGSPSTAGLAAEVEACLGAPSGLDRQRLAALWVAGAAVDWTRLYPGQTLPRRLHLPTYPFAGERYWRERLPPAPAAARMAELPQEPSERPADLLHAVPVWQSLDAEVAPVESGRQIIILCDSVLAPAALARALAGGPANPAFTAPECICLQSSGSNIAERYQSLAVQCFDRLQALLSAAGSEPLLLQCVVPGDEARSVYGGLSALLRTAMLEHARLRGQLLAVESQLDDCAALAACLRTLSRQPLATLARCRGGRLEVQQWRPLAPAIEGAELAYRDAGVYLVTGGLGGLGQLFAEDIVSRCTQATLILTGRAAVDPARVAAAAGLQRGRCRVEYRALDLLDAAAVARTVADIVAAHGRISGVLHCAGAVADRLLAKKTSAEFAATLLPKVLGTHHLDQATRELDLDFFVLFSSTASATGSIGQCDYAAANGFMDHFAEFRRRLERRGERRGVSVAIQWPYWDAGGMRIDPATRQVLAQSIGMQPMATAVGLQAFQRALAEPSARFLVAQGDRAKLLARLQGERPGASAAAPSMAVERSAVGADLLLRELRQMLATVLHARVEDIDPRRPLVELGLDSVLGTEFVAAINQRFGSTLSSVGIYDHPSVHALAQYLQAAQPRTPLLHAAPPASVTVAAPAVIARSPRSSGDAIAVIGMSGRYPGAPGLAAYWTNLVAGRDSIGEMPAARWDVDAYYDPDPDAEGRMYTRALGVLEDADCFDPRFFRITPQEALHMDPEQRLFLQEAYRALEDAGHAGGDADGLNCGVYLGMESSEYSWHFAGSPRLSETVTGNHAAIAAARLAYFLNLKGPALAVDTACSSSLVATHLACQALRNGEVDMALAGGVRLWLSPVTHVGMCKARMLSPSGRCRAFDDAADGIVMGEGVGAVVLKRLADAERDGDCIHGVILASAINQDGRTNGITAPSVQSQIALERRLYREHGIEPDSIGYIEAHGTGTRLGDPIELEALATVFGERTRRRGFCALGSVKTNIGHAAAASGIAGLHKVLLCLRHRELVPTLHVETENRHFDFAASAFHVNRQHRPWLPGSAGTRRAAVSSFGFSGTNAHLVVEEYRAHAALPTGAPEPVLITLSARTPVQLAQRAQDLLAFVEAEPPQRMQALLPALAWTLQAGRATLDERAAFVVQTPAELCEGLRALAGGAACAVPIARGRVVELDEATALWNDDDDLRQTLDKWLAGRRLAKLAGLWVRGVVIDWRKLHGARPPARISLPTYPFARERYWPERQQQAGAPTLPSPAGAVLHPLLHVNVSELDRQAYRTRLSGSEFFLSEHRVNGARVLPGVAYLEMVRAAVVLALPAEDTRQLEFSDHLWIRPVVADEAVELTLALYPADEAGTTGRRIEYEIHSASPTGAVLHASGAVRCLPDAGAAPALDLAAREHSLAGTELERSALYQRFAAAGLHYGPSMQGIARLVAGEGEVLATLRLPDSAGPHAADYLLHPSLLDAAMQCTICLFDGGGSTAGMPFGFDRMRLFDGSARDLRAWVRRAGTAAGGLQRFDIDLVDADGRPQLEIRGLVARALRELLPANGERSVGLRADDHVHPRGDATRRDEAAGDDRRPVEAHALRALLPIWNPVQLDADVASRHAGDRHLLLDGSAALQDWLQAGLGDVTRLELAPDATVAAIADALSPLAFDHLLWFAPDVEAGVTESASADMVAAQEAGLLRLFRILKALLGRDEGERELKLTLVTRRTQQVSADDSVQPQHAGVHGLVGSLAKELPAWRIRLLDIDTLAALSARELLSTPWDAAGSGLVHRRGEWLRPEFADVLDLPAADGVYKHNGVYLVIGGAGGLGEVWTRHLVCRFGANVVWIGRRPLDAAIEARLDAVAALGKRPLYVAVDAGDAAALAAVVRELATRFPKIDGVVHSALVLQDRGLRSMDEAVFRASLRPKVDVSVAIAQAFAGHDLDFLLFFSSSSSFHRGAGQANYCAGCAFKDSFAQHLRGSRGYPVKVVNWGYWGSVGVVADAFHRERMARLGVGSIEPEEAMRALQCFLGSGFDQLVLMKALSEAAFDGLQVSEELHCYDGPGRPVDALVCGVSET